MSDFRYLVVPHTHWDREWYLPFELFRLRLGSVVDGVLDALERDPSFTSFTLDGQAIVLEDYVEVRPENAGRLQALLDAGRLEAGPSYVLPDEILVGGESLVRNLLLGRRVCRRFGVEPSGAGYLPDSFGHPAQLPQILAGFGIRTFLFSRGMGDQIDDVGVVFRWRAGPAEVVACQMLPHYDNFARLTWHHDAEERVRGVVERFGEAVAEAGQDEIVLANGSDHLPIEPELPELLGGLVETFGARFRIGRYDEYAPAPEGLPVYEGELVDGRLQNILRGVNSARIYLKQANERAERRLLSIETAAALRTLREDAPYPVADLRLAWRDLLRNHPHDSICGCSCDEVHRDMLVRYEQLDRTLEFVEREAAGVGGAFVNTLPFRRVRKVDDGLVELDGFCGRRVEPFWEHNKRFDLEAIAEKLVFEDEPDIGDLYTFCPGGSARSARLVASRRNGNELDLEHELPGIRIETTIRAVPRLGRLELTTVVENEAEDHRLRVLIRSDGVRGRGAGREPVRGRPPAAQAAAAARGLGRAAGADGAHARRRRARLPRPAHEGAAGVRGRRGRAATDAAAVRRHDLAAAGSADAPSGRPARTSPRRTASAAAGMCSSTRSASTATPCRMRHSCGRARTTAPTSSAATRSSRPSTLDGDVVFSCLKQAEDGSGLVLRVFNPNPQPEVLSLSLPARRIRLDEAQDVEGGLELAPGEIATFLIGD